MKLVKPSYKILSNLDSGKILENIEIAGRTCYKSEEKITKESAKEFVKMIIKRGHESVLEHEKITVKIICDRGVSHELVRHRIASFSQESTRYCNYSKDKFNNQVSFIIPFWLDLKENTNYEITVPSEDPKMIWLRSMSRAEVDYFRLVGVGKWSPQQARSILPNSLKTEVVISANLREWRLIFKQRTAKVAHPQMREIMCPLLDELKIKLPIFFNDINY
jgi:thymidylate synthase (FAD)